MGSERQEAEKILRAAGYWRNDIETRHEVWVNADGQIIRMHRGDVLKSYKRRALRANIRSNQRKVVAGE